MFCSLVLWESFIIGSPQVYLITYFIFYPSNNIDKSRQAAAVLHESNIQVRVSYAASVTVKRDDRKLTFHNLV